MYYDIVCYSALNVFNLKYYITIEFSKSEIICDWYFKREHKDTKLKFKHDKRGKK